MRNIFRTIHGSACVRHCARCKTDENVEYSDQLQMYICDDCYEEVLSLENDDRIS